MNKHVAETVLFKLKPNVNREDFAVSAEAMKSFLDNQDGFLSRRLSCTEEDLWIDHIEWSSMTAAKDAAAKIVSAPEAANFMSHIDEKSVNMMHSKIEVSLN